MLKFVLATAALLLKIGAAGFGTTSHYSGANLPERVEGAFREAHPFGVLQRSASGRSANVVCAGFSGFRSASILYPS